MNIRSIGGDIADVAPDHAECAALWLRSGFNMRFSTWRFKFMDANRELVALDRRTEPERPWLSGSDSLWELRPSIRRLRYLYVFSNPDDAHAYRGLHAVNAAVTRCLDRMSMIGVKSVAFIHIPAVENNAIPTAEDDLKSAREMLGAISTWQADHAETGIEVVLVDRTDDFADLLRE